MDKTAAEVAERLECGVDRRFCFPDNGMSRPSANGVWQGRRRIEIIGIRSALVGV